MRLAVFGATGGTGRQLVEQAVGSGHHVTAVARRPPAITLRHPRLTVAECDVLEPEAVEAAVQGTDAVLSALGVHHRAPTTVYSTGTAHILDAMRAAGVRRLICLSSAGLTPHAGFPPLQALLVKLIVNYLYPHVYADMRHMEAQLQATAVAWTIIRAPGLTNGPRTGNYISTTNHHLPRQRSLSRADVADYILNHLDAPDTHRAWVELARTPH